jgi:RNA polymerase sigma factor (sigma-70 family)
MLKGLDALVAHATARAWYERGLGSPGQEERERVHDAVCRAVLKAKKDFFDWDGGRQFRYVRKTLRFQARKCAQKEWVKVSNWRKLCSEIQAKEGGQASVEEIVEARLTADKLRRRMETFSPPDRAILALIFSEQYSLRALSALLGCSEDCLESRVRRLRKKLRESIN